MFSLLTPLGDRVLPSRELEIDKGACRKIGSCGVGQKALYLGSRYISRRWYLPWNEVERVFKRVAMSAGGFSGRGIFGTMAYLVVQYGKGREKQCSFRTEAELDTLLELIAQEHPSIPTHSAQAAKKLAQAEVEEQKRFLASLPPEAEQTLSELREAKAFLESHPEPARLLTEAARQKRVMDQMKPWVLVLGAVMAYGGLALALWGGWCWLNKSPYSWYYILAGGALCVFAWTGGIVPGRWTSRKRAQQDWEEAVADAQASIAEKEAFPVPARYAHPVVLERMIRVVREGRADTAEGALAAVKEDLRALNASVTVSQKEHDEVVTVKPLFLVSDYQ